MKKTALIFLICFTTNFLFCEFPFAAVMYDSKDETKLGGFPAKRTLWADTIHALKKYQAKAVVLKMFFDQKKNEDEDQKLADAITIMPVFLQACFDNSEVSPNTLPEKFFYPVAAPSNSSAAKAAGFPLHHSAPTLLISVSSTSARRTTRNTSPCSLYIKAAQ